MQHQSGQTGRGKTEMRCSKCLKEKPTHNITSSPFPQLRESCNLGIRKQLEWVRWWWRPTLACVSSRPGPWADLSSPRKVFPEKVSLLLNPPADKMTRTLIVMMTRTTILVKVGQVSLNSDVEELIPNSSSWVYFAVFCKIQKFIYEFDHASCLPPLFTNSWLPPSKRANKPTTEVEYVCLKGWWKSYLLKKSNCRSTFNVHKGKISGSRSELESSKCFWQLPRTSLSGLVVFARSACRCTHLFARTKITTSWTEESEWRRQRGFCGSEWHQKLFLCNSLNRPHPPWFALALFAMSIHHGAFYSG